MQYIDEAKLIKDPEIGVGWKFLNTFHVDLFDSDLDLYTSSCGKYTIQVLKAKERANLFNSLGDEIARYSKNSWITFPNCNT
jgi:hypothetical protein